MKKKPVFAAFTAGLVLISIGTSHADSDVPTEPVPDCAIRWYEPLIPADIQSVDHASLFTARRLTGQPWSELPFSVTEVIYRAQRPTEHMLVVQDSDHCSVIWGPTDDLLKIPMGVAMEFPLAIERFNSFVAEIDIEPLIMTDEALVDYSFAVIKLASTAWTLTPPAMLLVEKASDIPGASGATFDVQAPVVTRSESAALIILYTWNELMGALNMDTVLVRQNGALAVNRVLIEHGVGDHLPGLARY